VNQLAFDQRLQRAWNRALRDPALQDLPYKIETNELGQLVMTPASNVHGGFQFEIGRLIHELMNGGKVQTECSIATRKGVKVADVVWRSDEFMPRNSEVTPYWEAPEICVEVVSPSNSRREQERKRNLYFERGAKEVWFCSKKGAMRFFTPEGELAASAMCPRFPKSV
jgi:Uma2 family endonuclease